MFRYRLDFGGGELDMVSVLEPDWVFQHGCTRWLILEERVSVVWWSPKYDRTKGCSDTFVPLTGG